MQGGETFEKWGKEKSIIIAINNESSVKKGESPFIAPFFNLYYFWGFIPFHFALEDEGSHYTLKKNKLQRTFCIFSNCLALAGMTYFTSTCVVELVDSKPATLIVSILESISNISDTILMYSIIYMLWRQEENLLEIVNCTRVSYDFIPHQRVKTLRRRVTMAAVLLNLASATSTLCLFLAPGHYISVNTNDTISQSSNVHPEEIESSPENEESDMEKITKVIMIGAFMYITALYEFIQNIFLIITLALRQLGEEFEMNLEKTLVQFIPDTINEESRIREGIEFYIGLKSAAGTIKKIVGLELLMFCIGSMTYYSEAPHILMGKRGDVAKVTFFFFMQTLVTWFLAAEFHQHVKDILCNWTERHLRSWDLKTNLRLRLMEISSEANIDPIALQNKYFMVTYSFIFGLLSMIVTYGLIVFQLQQGSDPQ